MVVNIRENVEEGESLARSLVRFPKAFSKLYVNMVTSGEASGTLDKVLQNLADYMEGQIELRRKVTSALVYPILMLFVCGAVVSALLVFVVPKIVDIFQKQGTPLPLPTKIVITFSNFLLGYWWMLIVAGLVAVSLVRFYYAQPAGRSRIDKLFLKMPIYGRLYTKVCTARVSRTLGTLLSSGVGLLDGIEIAKNIVTNVHVTKALEDARDGVREGRSLARELSKSGLFPPMLSHMVAVGEKSGELEDMLVKAGRAYEQDVNAALGSLTQIIEPVLMIIVGVLVLGIVVSMLLPMTDLIGALQQQH
jgi:general secretion pathway protein F